MLLENSNAAQNPEASETKRLRRDLTLTYFLASTPHDARSPQVYGINGMMV